MCLYTHRHTSAHGHIHGLRTRTRSDTHKHVSVRTNTHIHMATHRYRQPRLDTLTCKQTDADTTQRHASLHTRAHVHTRKSLFLPFPAAPLARTLPPWRHSWAIFSHLCTGQRAVRAQPVSSPASAGWPGWASPAALQLGGLGFEFPLPGWATSVRLLCFLALDASPENRGRARIEVTPASQGRAAVGVRTACSS